jgi:hypothetical protein
MNAPHSKLNSDLNPVNRPSASDILSFALGFGWFALWLAAALSVYAMRNFREDANEPPDSPLQLLLAALLFVAIGIPGLIIALITRHPPKSRT